MISKQQQKYIQSLHNKKYRTEYGLFLVEGGKALTELLAADFEVEKLYCTPEFAEKLPPALSAHPALAHAVQTTPAYISGVSTFKTNADGIAIVKQKRNLPPQNFDGLTLFLDDIKDPGNLGTIVRLADWYGITNVIASPETVEFYNPKVISSTMGSFTRVQVHYAPLLDFIRTFPHALYGADLEGSNVHYHPFAPHSGLVIGSESHGISQAVASSLSGRLTIPRLGGAESLNAAVAAAILVDNFFRNR